MNSREEKKTTKLWTKHEIAVPFHPTQAIMDNIIFFCLERSQRAKWTENVWIIFISAAFNEIVKWTCCRECSANPIYLQCISLGNDRLEVFIKTFQPFHVKIVRYFSFLFLWQSVQIDWEFGNDSARRRRTIWMQMAQFKIISKLFSHFLIWKKLVFSR